MNSLTALGPFGTIRPDDLAQALAAAGNAVVRRRRTWELEANLHCSLIGTCLTTTDVRHLLRKLKDPEADRADEHALHTKAVRLASNREIGGKLLNKALDRKHEVMVRRFARAKSPDDLRRLWEEANVEGDIPGGYWAILSHPGTDQPLVRDVFGEVHMLSHLVGRSSRADIKRIRLLEVALEERDARIAAFEMRVQRLTSENVDLAEQARQAALAARLSELAEAGPLVPAIAVANADTFSEPDDQRRLRSALAEMTRKADRLECEQRGLLKDLAAAEEALDGPAGREISSDADLLGTTILYVGGRPRLIDRLRTLVSERQGDLLSHDGGIEDARSLLPGLIGRADAVVFPVDCISHWAMDQVKRHCGLQGKPFFALRTASLACFLAALPDINVATGTV